MASRTTLAQAPVITSATPAAGVVEQWDKFEINLDIAANWSNPYDYDEIRVTGTFTAPDGQVTTVDGFFMQEYTIANEQTGAVNPVGPGRFKVRFSPASPAPGNIYFPVQMLLEQVIIPNKPSPPLRLHPVTKVLSGAT
ncbi:MAG: DUF5060 domain-containing protein [Lewinellaceae bacterium]|nr:DUF5060 domain-containing protein [Lewinellaceae bacterium]